MILFEKGESFLKNIFQLNLKQKKDSTNSSEELEAVLSFNDFTDRNLFFNELLKDYNAFYYDVWNSIKVMRLKSDALQMLYTFINRYEMMQDLYNSTFSEPLNKININSHYFELNLEPTEEALDNINKVIAMQKSFAANAKVAIENLIQTIINLPWSDFWPNEVSTSANFPSVENPLEDFINYMWGNQHNELYAKTGNFHGLQEKFNRIVDNCLKLIRQGVNQNLNNPEWISKYLLIQLRTIDGYIKEVKEADENVKEYYHEKELDIYAKCLENVKKCILEDFVEFLPDSIKFKYNLIDSADIAVDPLIWKGYITDFVDTFAPLIANTTIVYKGNSEIQAIVRKLTSFFLIINKEGGNPLRATTLRQYIMTKIEDINDQKSKIRR